VLAALIVCQYSVCQITSVVRPDGQSTSISYDAAGRIERIDTPRSPTNYSYSATTGNVTGIAAPDGVNLGYTYDGSLLLNESWAGPVSGTVARTYDNNMRVTATSVNGGNTINFSYDSDSLLIGAGALTMTRNAQHGLPTGSTLGSVRDSWTYNTFGEPTRYLAHYNATMLYDTSYTIDKLGRITQKVEAISGVATTYAFSANARKT